MAGRISYYGGIVTNGLVLALDAAKKDSYPGSGTVWRDISGNGNNGTLTNGPTFNSGNGGSIVFDGTNDYISFGSKKTSDFGLTTSNGASMCCWLNLTLLSRWTGVFNFWLANSVCDFGWDIYPSNVLRVWKNSGQNGTFPSLSSYNNTWCYYTLTSSSSDLKFYVNDTLILTSPQTGNINSSNNNFLTFGDHWDNPIQGKSSTLQIYNRTLSSTEISKNYNATKSRYGL